MFSINRVRSNVNIYIGIWPLLAVLAGFAAINFFFFAVLFQNMLYRKLPERVMTLFYQELPQKMLQMQVQMVSNKTACAELFVENAKLAAELKQVAKGFNSQIQPPGAVGGIGGEPPAIAKK